MRTRVEHTSSRRGRRPILALAETSAGNHSLEFHEPARKSPLSCPERATRPFKPSLERAYRTRCSATHLLSPYPPPTADSGSSRAASGTGSVDVRPTKHQLGRISMRSLGNLPCTAPMELTKAKCGLTGREELKASSSMLQRPLRRGLKDASAKLKSTRQADNDPSAQLLRGMKTG